MTESTRQLIVSQATISDRQKLFEFLDKAFLSRAHYKYPLRWQWQYPGNPFWKGESHPIWIVQSRGQIIGQSCAMAVPLHIGGVDIAAAWSCDSIVLPEFRGIGAGKLLQEANNRAHPIFMSLSMSAANRHIKMKLGAFPIDPVVVFHKPVSLGPDLIGHYLQHMLRHRKTLQRIASAACYLGAHMILWAASILPTVVWRAIYNSLPTAYDFSIEEVGRVGDEIADLWDRTRHDWGAIVRRDPAYINWRYADAPQMAYRIYVARRGQQAVGYGVMRLSKEPELPAAIIADLFCARNDWHIAQGLLNHMQDAAGRKIGYIEVAASDRMQQILYRRNGFIAVRHLVPMFQCNNPTVDCSAAKRPGSWFLTLGDHDLDQIRPAGVTD